MPRPLPGGRRLGAHLPLAGGMVAAAERAHEIGAQAMQVFADNPTAWRRRDEPPAELQAFRQRLADFDIGPNAIHGAYLINLAGPDNAFRDRSIEVLQSELQVAPSFGARFVNVHTGSHKLAGLDEGLRRIGKAVSRALADVDQGPDAAFLVLENSAGGGGGIGVTIAELEAILESIAAHGADPDRVRLCFDSAHLWAAGHPIHLEEGIDDLLDDVDRRIGLDRLVMIHLNDSKTERGCRIDRHEHLGAGTIGTTGLRHLLTHPRLAHVTYYIETPGMDEGYDAVNIARALAIAAGEPLDPLPPEAMLVRSSRARTAPPDDEA